jgi:Zinc carboxypeptidase/Chitobiase/beta-hexosaminidase C-terminal domain
MTFKAGRRVLVAVFACVFTWMAVTGAAAGQDARGIDPNQGDSLVEVTLANKGVALRLQLQAENYGIEFNDHYLRHNRDGSVTVTVFGQEEDFRALEDAGYEIGATIEGPDTWRLRLADQRAAVRAEARADDAALDDSVGIESHEGELVVLRVDYFENYAGRFLSVEAKTRDAVIDEEGDYAGPTLSLSFNRGAGTPIDSTPRVMNVNVDPDTTPNTYVEHRELVRIGEVDTTDPPRPSMIRIGSSTGASIEAPVNTWLAGGLPPMNENFISDFTTRYMDPTEVYNRFDELAAEYSNIAELIPLPYATNGYQRKAQANMSGTVGPGSSVPGSQQSGAVVLTSRAWGHEGGNQITAEFVNPGTANAPLGVSVNGNDITVNLATDAAGALSSTAQQVIAAINGNAQARQLVVANTYRGNAGLGIVQPRAEVSLSDFLQAPAHVPRGPYNYSVMRISKHKPGVKVGVFLYCQQHAREWATPLTCLETASQLLTNYATDRQTRTLVDNLDIYILPSSNPDGSHYSMYDSNGQRKTLTNFCVNGGQETDDPFAANFWTPRIRPDTGLPYTNTDAASRTGWGVDLNRNNTVGTIFDTFGGLGYIGASHSCTSEIFAGPGEASEPEIRNELWIADTFSNIKFSNNIHSFGGYFMWAPGAYLSDRSEGDLEHANIGVEKYFFEAGDRILNRIKDYRNTVILPERTGPISDVLYSAGGNSADEHWYNRDVIAYSFETGADRYVDPVLTVAAAAGVEGIRASNRTGFGEGDKVVIEPGTPNEEVAFVESVTPTNGTSPAPNVLLTAPLQRSHPAGSVLHGGTLQQGVGFQPAYGTEGKFEALEFAAGNYGLLESALAYARDDEPPVVTLTGPRTSTGPIDTTFQYVNEPSVIRYTLDGSRPTSSSPLWDSTGPREPGEVFHLTETTTIRWMATDIKGNVSTGRDRFVITGSG